MAIKRQQIIDALEARLKAILITGYYYTDIGSNVKVWMTEQWDPDKLPGINIRDVLDEETIITEAEEISDHRMTVNLDISLKGPTSIVDARKTIADIQYAIGLDETFGMLAKRTVPVFTELKSEQDEHIITGIFMQIIIEYETFKFSES